MKKNIYNYETKVHNKIKVTRKRKNICNFYNLQDRKKNLLKTQFTIPEKWNMNI